MSVKAEVVRAEIKELETKMYRPEDIIAILSIQHKVRKSDIEAMMIECGKRSGDTLQGWLMRKEV